MACFCLLFIAGHGRAADVVWTNTAGGDWNTAGNWSPNQVPGGNDSAWITNNGSYTVTSQIYPGINISNLVVGGISGTQTFSMYWTLTNNGLVTVNSNGVMHDNFGIYNGLESYATLAGLGGLTSAGLFTWDGALNLPSITNSGVASLAANQMNGCDFVNSGALTLTSYYYFNAGSILSNTPSGTITLTILPNSDSSWTPAFEGNGGTIFNAGLMLISAPGYSINANNTVAPWEPYSKLPLINSGTLLVTNSSNFSLEGGGTNLGIIMIDSGSTLICSNNYQFGPGKITGGGTFVNEFAGLNLSGTIACAIFRDDQNQTTTVTGALDATNSIFDASTLFTNTGSLQGSILVRFGSLTCMGSGLLQPYAVNIQNIISGTNPIIATGPLTWTNSLGGIYDSVSVNGGIVNDSSSVSIGGGGQLINTGPLNWVLNSGPRTGSGAIISNAPSGVITAIFNGNSFDNYVYGGGMSFYNAGTMNLSGTNQTGFFTCPFYNSGAVNVSSGTLDLSGGGTNNGGLNLGSVGTLNVTANYSFASGSMISGTSTNVFSGGTVNFLGNASISSGLTWLLTGSIINLSGSGTISPANLVWTSGNLQGTQPLTVSGPLTWNGTSSGSLNDTLTVNGGIVNVPAGFSIGAGGQLINTGQLNWTPNSGPRTGTGSVISNTPAGIINAVFNGNSLDNYVYGGSAAFDNAGTLNLSGSSQTGYFSGPFYNSGSVNINSGMLDLSGGGNNNGGLNLGSVGTLNVTANYSFASGSMISGTSTNIFSGGTVSFLGNASISSGLTWMLTGSIINLSGSGTISPANLVWTSGNLQGTQPLTVSGPLTWNGTSSGSLNDILTVNGGIVNVPAGFSIGAGGQLINTGQLNWTPNSGPRTGNGSVISNTPAGIINAVFNGNSLDNYVYGGSAAFDNAGTINLSGSGQTGYFSGPFYNSGTININSGTLLANDGMALNTGKLNFTISTTTNYGTLNVSGGLPLSACRLGVSLNGYVPNTGDNFNLITYGSESGHFAGITLPNAGVWKTTYAPTAFNVAVLSPSSLAIVQIGTDVVISWPSNLSLYETTNLTVPGDWILSTNTATTANGVSSFTLVSPVGNKFFQIR